MHRLARVVLQSAACLRLIAALAALLASACASDSGPALAAADLDQQGKHFAPRAGKAAIYVYRKDGWRGSAGTFPVTVDGRLIGRIHNGTYYVFEVDPGDHEVWVGWDQSIAKTVNDPIAHKLVLVPVRAVAGKAFFVRVAQTGQEHAAVSEQEGKQELLACCRRVADPAGQKQLFQ